MKTKLKSFAGVKIFALFAAAAMLIGFSPAALADHDSVVPQSRYLEVYVIKGGNTSLLHKYTIAELEGLTDAEDVYYSSVDAMPAKVLTIATGVTIDTIISDCYDYTTDIELADFSYLRFEASDGWSRTYDYDAINDANKYYYGGLLETDTFSAGSGGSWTINVTDVKSYDKWNVMPMLAIYSVQDRVFDSNDFEDIRNTNLTRDGSLRFCIGQTENDLSRGISTTSQFGRGITTLEIIMDRNYTPTISVTGIMISNDKMTIGVNETETLTATIVPPDATDKRVEWSSSDPSVATVSSNGAVTGEKAGKAVITVQSRSNPNYSAECAVTVTSGGGGGGASDGTTADEPTETPANETPGMKVYSDVKQGDWFNAAVEFVSSRGLMKGKGSEDTFAPNDLNTRAEWITVLARMSGAAAANVSSAPWYQAVLDWAVAEGITDGSNPTGAITREQVVVMLWRLKGSPKSQLDVSIFAESDRVSDWAKDAMLWAIEENIILGDARGSAGSDNITRAEVATILMRYAR
ncbi:MAG: Ig-like domain-containing protein [Oscillospiraceae bacterium]|jgi:uncharacterized protein YjdB|nr:Ig-like domain-containing protein [Oscillospiraceae bacterium]